MEVVGPPAVLVGMGDGSNRAVHAAAARPDLVDAVVCAAGNPVGASAVEGTDGLAGSESVLEALMSMMETDYRGALRTMIGTANPSFDEETLRDARQLDVRELSRRTWLPSACARGSKTMRWSRPGRSGDRLWVLEPGGNPWFPIEVARRSRALVPEGPHPGGGGRCALAPGHHRRLRAQPLDRGGRGRAPERERAAPIRDPS